MMEKLGFRIDSQQYTYRYKMDTGYLKYSFFTKYNIGEFKVNIDQPSEDLDSQGNLNTPLMGITHLDGSNAVAISNKYYDELPKEMEFYSNMYDICVPIRFYDEALPGIFESSIFWFYPSESFFNCLPDSIGLPMRKEYDINVAPKLSQDMPEIVISDFKPTKPKAEEAIPCEYFPSFCEGLPGLDNLNVFPNPTSGVINLELSLGKAKQIDFRVFDLSGRLVLDEIERKTYPDAGMYTERLDIGHLQNGFYLLVLTDEEGARMTKRIVKN